MRVEFADELVRLAERDERVVLLTGDLGFHVLEPFMEHFPDRFYNVGVAEQNMLGLATGLAEGGFVPFCYSIATFVSMRPYEFVRNGGALHELPVRIVGIGGGFDYGHEGITHFALEDVGLFRVQPGMAVIAPADADQARAALRATAGLMRPIYFRVGREAAAVPGLDGHFELGRISVVAEGSDVAIVAMGTLAGESVDAVGLLAEQQVSASLAVVSSVSPPPVDDLVELLSGVPVAVTVEAHYVNGGLGSLVGEIIAERGLSCRLVRCGVREMPRGVSGSRRYLYERYGLTGPRLAATALEALGSRPSVSADAPAKTRS